MEHATSDLEVRVWVNEGTELTISLLEIAAHSDNDNQIVLEHQVQANEPSVAPEAQAQKVEVSTSTPSESKASNKYPNKKPSPSYSNKRKNKR
ncbi:hypothetical protein [Deefgea sp. CFH1-16]|uniref:hypothetical protein n=1 Tax=Deefgea sp. CFH1-16 TaxID=2675457 RepID=UPI0015F42250|nr:hypothetical protein [Deefgea sp. CFH1-16]